MGSIPSWVIPKTIKLLHCLPAWNSVFGIEIGGVDQTMLSERSTALVHQSLRRWWVKRRVWPIISFGDLTRGGDSGVGLVPNLVCTTDQFRVRHSCGPLQNDPGTDSCQWPGGLGTSGVGDASLLPFPPNCILLLTQERKKENVSPSLQLTLRTSKLHCSTSKSFAPPPFSLGLITRGDVWPWFEAAQRRFNAL